jgi:hypothetical protein
MLENPNLFTVSLITCLKPRFAEIEERGDKVKWSKNRLCTDWRCELTCGGRDDFINSKYIILHIVVPGFFLFSIFIVDEKILISNIRSGSFRYHSA